MSLPRENQKSQPPWSDLAVFFGVLAVLALSLRSFLAPREAPRFAPAPARTLAALPAEATGAPESRGPASPTVTPAGSSTEILRVPCPRDAALSFTSRARLLQIHGPLCDGDARTAGAWRAANRSSGEEILVFVNEKDKTVSTSYFSLKDGANELVFTQDLGRGRTREAKLVVRRPEQP